MGVESVILHCDLDCFYAQVERERLGLPKDAAIVVVQWQMALAVSYPARKYGIKRGSNVEEIKKLGGDNVVIVHVETIGGDSSPAKETTEREDGKEVVNTEKVSLARYRKASGQVFSAMADVLKGYGAKLERSSIDEAYIDVTAEVDKRLHTLAGETRSWPSNTLVVGDKLDLQNETDVRLAFGADVAAEVRAKVYTECSYTVSAGISVNKLLAKFASAQNKPNKQTIVPLAAVSGLLADVPVNKLRGLGGKLGKEVEAIGISTCADALKFSVAELEKKLGHRKVAEFVYNSVRGLDDSEVVERNKVKSLLAAKSFRSQMSLAPVEEHWLPILADELAERLEADSDFNNRDAKTLTVTFRVKLAHNAVGMTNVARSTAMPIAGEKDRSRAIQACAVSILRKSMIQEKQFKFPISFVGLTATNFVDRARANENIQQYFSTAATDLVGGEGGPELCSSVGGRWSKLSPEEAQRKRLQEKADREMALRLHREESAKAGGKNANGIVKARKTSKSKGKVKDKEQTFTMDKFVFKSRNGKLKR